MPWREKEKKKWVPPPTPARETFIPPKASNSRLRVWAVPPVFNFQTLPPERQIRGSLSAWQARWWGMRRAIHPLLLKCFETMKFGWASRWHNTTSRAGETRTTLDSRWSSSGRQLLPLFFGCFFVLLLSLAWRLVHRLCHVVPVPPVRLVVLAPIDEAPPVVRGGPGLSCPAGSAVPPSRPTVLGAGGTSHSNNSLAC